MGTNSGWDINSNCGNTDHGGEVKKKEIWLKNKVPLLARLYYYVELDKL